MMVLSGFYKFTIRTPTVNYLELTWYLAINATLIYFITLPTWILFQTSSSVWFVSFALLSHLHSDNLHATNIQNQKSYELSDNYLDKWAKLQVESSTNYMTNSPMFFYLSSGQNFQIEHHLFPYLSHDKYHLLSNDVERICAAYGVRYTRIEDFGTLLGSTWSFLAVNPPS